MNLHTGEKDSRYWPWEIPIALLLVSGAVIFGMGVPLVILSHSDWATLFIGLVEAAVGVLTFAVGRANAVRAGGIALFFGGAVAFIAALVSIVSIPTPSFGM
jgi:hypothetical protein